MNMKKFILYLLICFFCSITITSFAQTYKVDSILSILQAAPKLGRVDTNITKKILQILNRIKLTDNDINKIVAISNEFKTGSNEDMAFRICQLVANRLNNTDINIAIDFEKILLERIEQSKTPEKMYFRNSILVGLRIPFRNSQRLAEGFDYYNNYLLKCKERNDPSGIQICHYVLSGFYRTTGLFDRAIYHGKKSLAYLDSSKRVSNNYFTIQNDNRSNWITGHALIAEYYYLKGEISEALKFNKIAFSLQIVDNSILSTRSFVTQGLAKMYFNSNQLDSAARLIKLAYEFSKNNDRGILVILFQTWSLFELKNRNFRQADSLLVEAWKIIKQQNIPANSLGGLINPDYYRALIAIEERKYVEAVDFLLKDIERIKIFRIETLRDYKLLAQVYDKMDDYINAKKNYKLFIDLQDSLIADQNKYNAISFEAEQQINEKELSLNQLKNESKIAGVTRNFTIGLAVLFIVLAATIYYRFQAKKKANLILEKTLQNLKSTQAQLIQSEKMASLGELTAGIAHEIQNPLNFVNNFSEVSNELIDEMNEELAKGDIEEAKSIAKDVKQNLEKITHHGKRADAIVKGMLQHSRSGSGQKEPTDINQLCDEYLRLAYHGLRAKDKSFNATLKTEFDETIGLVNILPQDIGRVVLNLITNAFYVVAEKAKQGKEGYIPTVTVRTQKINDRFEIKVADNGNGIPPKILDKIFQPFFTTKPTGEGTGLGLSLSYDIVKSHGGELMVETEEGVGTVFIIKLSAK